jgi:hypothetical protein
MMKDIAEIITSRNNEEEEQIGTKFYVELDKRTILMEYALEAVREIERLREVVLKLSVIVANPYANVSSL